MVDDSISVVQSLLEASHAEMLEQISASHSYNAEIAQTKLALKELALRHLRDSSLERAKVLQIKCDAFNEALKELRMQRKES